MLRNLVTFSSEIPKVEDMDINHTYMLTLADGVYRYKRTPLMLIKEKLERFENTLVGLSKGSEGVELLIPKVPFKLWLMSLDFFKDIYNKFGTEASTIIYYIQDIDEYTAFYESLTSKEQSSLLVYKNFLIQAPLQENEQLLTSFGDCPLFNKLCDMTNIVKVIELHSHHVMDAYWSKTDNRNQNEDCFYGVFGNLDDKDDFLMKYVVHGSNVNIKLEKLFLFPLIEVTTSYKVDKFANLIKLQIEPKVEKIPFEGVLPNNSTYPEEWFDMVTAESIHQDNKSNYNKSTGYWGEEKDLYARAITITKPSHTNLTTNETKDIELIIRTYKKEIEKWGKYRKEKTLKPIFDNLNLYSELENLRIFDYLVQTHRILALEFILSYLNNEDYTDIKEAFENSSENIKQARTFMLEKGYLTDEDPYGDLANLDNVLLKIHLYFAKVDELIPRSRIPNLSKIDSLSKSY